MGGKPKISQRKPKQKSTAKKKVVAKSAAKPKKTKGSQRFEDIKNALMIQRETLLAEAGTVMNSTVRVGSCPDLTDQASAESNQAFVLKLKEREQKLLTKIEETLAQIKQGTYGICQGCDAPIPYQRLKVRPVTTLCIECKTLQEEEEKIRLG